MARSQAAIMGTILEVVLTIRKFNGYRFTAILEWIEHDLRKNPNTFLTHRIFYLLQDSSPLVFSLYTPWSIYFRMVLNTSQGS